MGYQIVFKPSEDQMGQYKQYNGYSSDLSKKRIQQIKDKLLCKVLMDYDGDFDALHSDLTFGLEFLKNEQTKLSEYENYLRWENDEKKELWFCGWEYSNDDDLDPDSVKNNTITDLCILTTVVKTPNRFDDYEKFDNLVNEVYNKIDGFAAVVETHVNHEIINKLKELKVEYTE